MAYLERIVQSGYSIDRLYEKMYNFHESPDGCWIYNGYKDADGYAYASFGRKFSNIAMYRLWWELFNGKEIPANKLMDHTCRTRSCINPKHLEVVNTKTNTRRGKSAKLMESQISEIKSLWKTGEYTQRAIAKKYNVSPATICYILSNSTWLAEPVLIIHVR